MCIFLKSKSSDRNSPTEKLTDIHKVHIYIETIVPKVNKRVSDAM